MIEQLLKPAQVAKILGVCLNTMKKIQAEDDSFPKPIRLSSNRVAYRQTELLLWIAER